MEPKTCPFCGGAGEVKSIRQPTSGGKSFSSSLFRVRVAIATSFFLVSHLYYTKSYKQLVDKM